jgi:hypothetical protein
MMYPGFLTAGAVFVVAFVFMESASMNPGQGRVAREEISEEPCVRRGESIEFWQRRAVRNALLLSLPWFSTMRIDIHAGVFTF